MANPRKFSEKIALHVHRQAEETARFEEIMKEVSAATARDETPNMPMVNYRHGSRSRSQGGPIRRPHDRLDTSPYSSTTFLSPPHDTSWRRTHSDSALHQSAMQDMNSERNDPSNSRWMLQNMNGPDRHDGRPRSSCEVPRVPGIHIYPSQHVPGTIQIPISGNNTGSLPDLTNVNFSSPIPVPLDQDPDQGSSPYSSSPVNTSPSTLSPTSIPQGVRQGFHFTPPPLTHSNHLSVPRYPNHLSKNIPLDGKNMTGLVDGSDFTQLSGWQQCPPTSPSPTIPQATSYRSQRPSPQSSPTLGGRHSAPCSPGAPSPHPNDYNFFQHPIQQHSIQQHSIQQHFEQLTVGDPPVSNVPYVEQPSVQLPQSHSQNIPGHDSSTVELTSDGGYYSTSPQVVYPSSLHTTPNTPTSIPDITLTDFSSATDEISRQDLNKHLEQEFFSDSLRESLEPLNFDELQMLTDPTMSLISDTVEDGFRLHRS